MTPVDRDPRRFEDCRCVLYGGALGGGAEPIEVRRCPVGVIAAVDCPEFVGARCAHYVARGSAPPSFVARAEVAALRAELSRDYLTAAYERRLRGLRSGAPLESRFPTRPGQAGEDDRSVHGG